MAEGLVDRPPLLLLFELDEDPVADMARDCASNDDLDLFIHPLGRAGSCWCCWYGEVGVRSPPPLPLPLPLPLEAAFELLELLRFRKLNGLIPPLLLLGECARGDCDCCVLLRWSGECCSPSSPISMSMTGRDGRGGGSEARR